MIGLTTAEYSCTNTFLIPGISFWMNSEQFWLLNPIDDLQWWNYTDLFIQYLLSTHYVSDTVLGDGNTYICLQGLYSTIEQTIINVVNSIMAWKRLQQGQEWDFSQTEEGYLNQPGLAVGMATVGLEKTRGLGRSSGKTWGWAWFPMNDGSKQGVEGGENGIRGMEISKWQDSETRAKNKYLYRSPSI